MTRPHPDLWHPLAVLLSALRAVRGAAAPAGFGAVSSEVQARVRMLAVLVRRYIHVLAAEIHLPPPRSAPILLGRGQPAGRSGRDYLFPLTEQSVAMRRAHKSGGEDPPGLRWALLFEAARRLSDVPADPARYAARLARHLRRAGAAPLKGLPVRWSVLRRLGPEADALLCRLDQRARPEAWAEIGEGEDTS